MSIGSLSEILHGIMSFRLHHGDTVNLDAFVLRLRTDLPCPTV